MYYSLIFFFNQKTACEVRISDWSSDVCSSDLQRAVFIGAGHAVNEECSAPALAEMAGVEPQPGRLEQHLGRALIQDGSIAGGRQIDLQRIGDGGIDVILGRTGGIVGRTFAPADCAPRVKRALCMADRTRMFARIVKVREAIFDQVPGKLR